VGKTPLGFYLVDHDVMFVPDDASFKEHSPAEFSAREIPAPPDPSEFELMDFMAENFGDRYLMVCNECVSLTLLDEFVKLRDR